MSLDVHVATPARIPVSRERVAELAQRVLRAEGVRAAELSITFLDDRAIARMNREHLAHEGPTDVISFGFTPATSDEPVTGDIYIGVETARRNAAAARVGVREELQRLVIHGILHVLGHDHPDGNDRLASPMWKKQERLVARLVQRPSR